MEHSPNEEEVAEETTENTNDMVVTVTTDTDTMADSIIESASINNTCDENIFFEDCLASSTTTTQYDSLVGDKSEEAIVNANTASSSVHSQNRKSKLSKDSHNDDEISNAAKRTRRDDNASTTIIASADLTPDKNVAANNTKILSNEQVLHPCLQLTDPAFIMIPVPKICNPTASTIQFDLAVPKSATGNLIGRGGCRIKVTREQSGANIKVHNNNNSGSTAFRSISITGSLEQCRLAFTLIADQVNDLNSAANKPAHEGGYTLTLLIANNKVGGFIGQKGVTINELRNASQAGIALAKGEEMQNGSMDRCITVTGTFPQVCSYD